MIRVASEQSGCLGVVHPGMWVNPSKPAVHTQFTQRPVINSCYRGEVGVILANLGEAAFTVRRAMRIAQLVVAPVTRVEWDEAEELADTARGAGGFGSTGTKGGE